MAALVIDLPATNDSPDLAAFKQKVYTVAKRDAKAHGWCSVVDKALKELGIEPAKPIRVKVTTVAPFVTEQVVSVDPTTLAGRSEAAQKRVIVGLLGKVRVGNASFDFPVDQIDTMELATTGSVVNGALVAPEGYEWKYSSEQGRVTHLFSTTWSRWDDSLCDQVTPYSLSDTSSRATGGQCIRCTNRASNL